MSYRASAWALLQLPESTEQSKALTLKAVLMVLADFHRNDTGLCFPAANTVADLLMCNERTVRRALEELERQGFIRLTKRNRRPPYVEFNWTRPGGYEFENRSPVVTDNLSVEASEVSGEPQQVRDTEGRFTATDNLSVSTPRTDKRDTPVRTMTTILTDNDAQSTDKLSGEPGNQEEPGGSWQPSSTTQSALKALFGKDFEIPDHWIPMFLVKCESDGKPPNSWNAFFIEWARYQIVRDRKMKVIEDEGLPAQSRQRKKPLLEDVSESPQARLRHAEKMLNQMQAQPALKTYWTDQVAKIKAEIS